MKVKKGDLIQVISGRDSGKQGRVEQIVLETGRVVVEGVNLHKRHFKPSKARPKGGIIDLPMPLDRSNVMVICPHCSKPTRVKHVITDTAKYRACMHCNDSLDSK